MKKKEYPFIIFLIFIFINLFKIDNLSYLIMNSCSIWLNNLVPSIFPFYIIADLLINYGFIEFLRNILKKPFYKLFKITESAIFVFIFSMLTGFPSGAKYISNLVKEDLISEEEANKIIRFCHFSNPLFIINTIGSNILHSKKLGYLILISHFLSNFIIAFIFRNESYDVKSFKRVSKKLGYVLTNSIINTFDSLIIILGNIIVFQILVKIIFSYFSYSNMLNSMINIFFEITSGIFMLDKIDIDIYIKAIIITSAISFGGICIHSQVYGIISETKIK